MIKMKNKKLIIYLFIIFLILSIPLIAQISNEIERSENLQQPRNADSLNYETRLKIIPDHHMYLPRRQTIISLKRFEEEINLDKIIKQSNQLLD